MRPGRAMAQDYPSRNINIITVHGPVTSINSTVMNHVDAIRGQLLFILHEFKPTKSSAAALLLLCEVCSTTLSLKAASNNLFFATLGSAMTPHVLPITWVCRGYYSRMNTITIHSMD